MLSTPCPVLRCVLPCIGACTCKFVADDPVDRTDGVSDWADHGDAIIVVAWMSLARPRDPGLAETLLRRSGGSRWWGVCGLPIAPETFPEKS